MARSVRDGKISGCRCCRCCTSCRIGWRATTAGRTGSYWPLVNPNLGRSTNEDFLAREVMRAEADGPAAVALIARSISTSRSGCRSGRWLGRRAVLEPRRRGRGADARGGARPVGGGRRRDRRRRAGRPARHCGARAREGDARRGWLDACADLTGRARAAQGESHAVYEQRSRTAI